MDLRRRLPSTKRNWQAGRTRRRKPTMKVITAQDTRAISHASKWEYFKNIRHQSSPGGVQKVARMLAPKYNLIMIMNGTRKQSTKTTG